MLVLLVWWVVAHSSGSGWVQVLGDSVFGMLIVGLFAPVAGLARIRMDLGHAPCDGAAGIPSVIELRSSARARITPIQPPGPDCFVGPTRNGRDDEVTLLPVSRGVHDEVVLGISTAAPFGLQWWTRRFVFRLPSPLHIAPRLGEPTAMPSWVDERTGTLGRSLPGEAGDARGVRDYRRGDRRPRVHWIASAHAGRLMVRELEYPASQPVTLRVNLPLDELAAERTAERALGTVVELLDRGVPLILATDESARSVTAPVASRREAGRRLARAISSGATPGVELLA